MNAEEYPALYRSADASSVSSQSIYLWLIRLQYGLLLVAAILANWFNSEPNTLIMYPILIGGATVLLVFMAVKKPEKDWYACRALAESIKTSTWRFTMRAEPFVDAPNLSVAKADFAGFLREILDANKHIDEPISRRPVVGDQITPRMISIRALSLADRKEIYRKNRIDEQRAWYVKKAKSNRRSFTRWIVFCGFVQAGAIALAVTRIHYGQQWNFWPTEPLLITATAIIGWIQIKKFNELASAYSLTAHEIGIIQSRIDIAGSEEEFSEFVNEAERAFSREHTQWIARQNN